MTEEMLQALRSNISIGFSTRRFGRAAFCLFNHENSDFSNLGSINICFEVFGLLSWIWAWNWNVNQIVEEYLMMSHESEEIFSAWQVAHQVYFEFSPVCFELLSWFFYPK
jgi:hypothetical protein